MPRLSITQECVLRNLDEQPFDVSDKYHVFHRTKPTNTLNSLVRHGFVFYEEGGGSSGAGQYSLTEAGKAIVKQVA